MNRSCRLLSMLGATLILLLSLVLFLGLTLPGVDDARAQPVEPARPHASGQTAPVTLTVTGPLTVVQQSPVWFTATVAPPTTTLPITYVWQATPQYSQIHTNVQSIQDTVSFTWSLTGTQRVTVTASNGLSTPLESAHTVVVVPPPPPQPPLTLTVTGPQMVVQQRPLWFTATVAPPTTTLPITYVWQATPQYSQIHTNVQSTQDIVSFTWSLTGTQQVTVTASNGLSTPLQSTYTVTVAPPQPPLTLTVTGPLTAVQRSPAWFTATIAPPTTTLPITYTWWASEHTSRTHFLSSLQDVISFSWDVTGTQQITVTASNGLSTPLQRTHILTVEEAPPTYVYLPVVLNQYPESATACDPILGQTYAAISVVPEGSQPPSPNAEEDAAFNINLLDFQTRSDHRYWVSVGDGLYSPPQFAYVYADPHRPTISEAYQLYYNGELATAPFLRVDVSALGLPTTAGQEIHVPERFGGSVVIDVQRYKALVLYASQQSITLKYTREDGLAGGYTVHIDGICVEPTLQALYDQVDAEGRTDLPAVFGHQPIGRAWGEEIRIAIRDWGTLLDPRWLGDWWIHP